MTELIDNSRKRIDTLADIIKDLHKGKDVEKVKAKLTALVRETTSEEIVSMEQQLIAEGMKVEEIKEMCDLHSQVMGSILTERIEDKLEPGHPLHTFRAENVAIAKVVEEMRQSIKDTKEDSIEESLTNWRSLLEQLLEVEKHYARKENILFSHLERHEITGPSQVMWGKDDDIRFLMKSLREALMVESASFEDWRVVIDEVAVPMLDQVEEMINKEDRILFPLSQKKLTEEEWGAVHRESSRFGFCLVEPGTSYVPPHLQEITTTQLEAERIPVGAGSLTWEQLKAIFTVLPVDLTFVDADDRVAFFSEGPDRIFSRTAAIIGRKVQNCHPPNSVSVVDKILTDFRSGKQNIAEFWIEMGPRFIHIRYFAVRDENNNYIGTLEVTQDGTRLRSLSGERRLLQYEESS